MIQKTKVFIPVDGVSNYDAILAYVNETNLRLKVKEQEGYFFTTEELAKMRRLDYENGYFQKGVHQDEICTPDDYMSALLLIIN